MFTGIVVDKGVVRRARMRKGSLDLEIEAASVARQLQRGDSVAVNGVCLTATETSRKRFAAHAIEETLIRTTLGDLKRSDLVNLELPARLMDRLGGHLVQGHIDGTVRVLRIEESDGARSLWFGPDEHLLDYMVPKGSIAIDGVSLTLVDVGRTSFQVALVPHTLEATTLHALSVGDLANIEVDVIAKYIERLINRSDGSHV